MKLLVLIVGFCVDLFHSIKNQEGKRLSHHDPSFVPSAAQRALYRRTIHQYKRSNNKYIEGEEKELKLESSAVLQCGDEVLKK